MFRTANVVAHHNEELTKVKNRKPLLGCIVCNTRETHFETLQELQHHFSQHVEADRVMRVVDPALIDQTYSTRDPKIGQDISKPRETGDTIDFDPTACLYCSKSFPTVKDRANHEFVAHLNEWNRQCPRCQRDYRHVSFTKFHDHVKSHFNVYECNLCPLKEGNKVKFRTLNGKLLHMDVVHQEDGIPCYEPCPFHAKGYDEYKQHMALVHGSQE